MLGTMRPPAVLAVVAAFSLHGCAADVSRTSHVAEPPEGPEAGEAGRPNGGVEPDAELDASPDAPEPDSAAGLEMLCHVEARISG